MINYIPINGYRKRKRFPFEYFIRIERDVDGRYIFVLPSFPPLVNPSTFKKIFLDGQNAYLSAMQLRFPYPICAGRKVQSREERIKAFPTPNSQEEERATTPIMLGCWARGRGAHPPTSFQIHRCAHSVPGELQENLPTEIGGEEEGFVARWAVIINDHLSIRWTVGPVNHHHNFLPPCSNIDHAPGTCSLLAHPKVQTSVIKFLSPLWFCE